MLLGIVGQARSGKSSACSYLLEQHRNYYQWTLSFADALKEAAIEIWDIDFEEAHGLNGYDREKPHPRWGISVREMLQELGTVVREKFGENHWIDRALDPRLDLSKYIIPDVRYPNEVAAIKAAGGIILGLVRDGEDMPEVRPHSSEEMARDHLEEVSDHVIRAGCLEELYSGLDRLMSELYEDERSSLPSPAGS